MDLGASLKPACQALRTWPDNPLFGAFFTNSLTSTSCWSNFPHCDVFLGRTTGTCRQFSSMIKHVWAASITSTYNWYRSIWMGRCGVGQVVSLTKDAGCACPWPPTSRNTWEIPWTSRHSTMERGQDMLGQGWELATSDSWDCIRRYCTLNTYTYCESQPVGLAKFHPANEVRIIEGVWGGGVLQNDQCGK